MASTRSPVFLSTSPRASWRAGSSGFSRRASRYSAVAAGWFPEARKVAASSSWAVDQVVRGPQSVGQTQAELGIARAQARRGAMLGQALADIPRLGERRSETG